MSNSTFNKDTDIKEYRRKLIVRLSKKTTLSQTEISQIVDCSQGYVSQVLTAYEGGGLSELASGVHLGANSQLSNNDLEALKSLLSQGAKAQGFRENLWTRKRVHQLIKTTFGIDYTLQHISNILAKIDYTLQRPQAKDPRQDKEAVRKWKEEELQALKQQATTEGRAFFYADESSFLLNPRWHKTYAPKGHPPIVDTWDKSFNYLSVCAAIGSQGEFIYTLHDKSYTGAKIVEFLKELLAYCPDPITLVWDGASIHFCKVVKSYLATLAEGRLKLVRQPSYSPELNASEQLWNYTKNVDLKNQVFKSVASLKKALVNTLDKFHNRPGLIQRFFNHSEVAFY